MVLAACAAALAFPSAARADNCSGLSDCSTGIKIALAVLAIVVIIAIGWALAAALAPEVAAAGAIEAGAAEAAAAEAAAAEATAAGSEYAGMTTNQIAREVIGREQTELLREFFGTSVRGAAEREAAFEVPAGLTRTSLEAYRELAERAIAKGADTLGVQAARLRLIERALELIP